ncbi:MAG: PadR family transcriptional regulator [Firmicutes bacterium]|nr:PadR family transcriptional regulator [Bacillota bacterium]
MGSSALEPLTDNIFFILVSLLKDKHGYLIMQTIEDLTDGEFVIGPASLYTNLKKLLKAGLIEEKPGEKSNRKVYAITASGIEALRTDLKRRKKMVRLAQQGLSLLDGGEKQ